MSLEDGGHLHELLEALESGALALERNQTEDPSVAIHRLFQSAHNLKSGLAMAGLNRASKLVHSLEDGLDDIRRGRGQWSSSWADALFSAVDRVKQGLDDGHDDNLDISFSVLASLPQSSSEHSGPKGSTTEQRAVAQARAAGERLFRIEKLFLPGLSQEDFEGHLILEDIGLAGTLLAQEPLWSAYSLAQNELVVRYWFRSPQTAEALADVFFDPLIELPTGNGPAPKLKFRVLVVEDDALASQVIEKALEGLADIVWAQDGPRGVAEYQLGFERRQPFDVVICDLELPGMDGVEALKQMRAFEEAQGIWGLDCCHIYMNTSSRNFGHVQQSFRLQADGYFIKPLSVEKIKKKLEQNGPWLETRRGVSR